MVPSPPRTRGGEGYGEGYKISDYLSRPTNRMQKLAHVPLRFVEQLAVAAELNRLAHEPHFIRAGESARFDLFDKLPQRHGSLAKAAAILLRVGMRTAIAEVNNREFAREAVEMFAKLRITRKVVTIDRESKRRLIEFLHQRDRFCEIVQKSPVMRTRLVHRLDGQNDAMLLRERQ